MAAPQSCPAEQTVWLSVTDPGLVGEADLEHVRSCPRCRGRADRLRQVDELLPQAAGPSTGSTARLLAGRYQLDRRLGSGGFGEVWVAQDVQLNQRVALKMVRADRLSEPAREALRAEARLLADVTANPRVARHIVSLKTCGEDAGRFFLVMEYVEGGSLGQRVRQFGPLDWRQAARYVADVGEALQVLHEKGLIHRDVKPDNVLWDEACDEALLADFGISARQADAQGYVSGTAGYIAPEMQTGACTAASDVFALAATLYHLLTGAAPFQGKDVSDSLAKAQKGLPRPDPRLARVPAALEEAIAQALHPSPSRRSTLPAFLAALRGSGAQSLASSVVSASTCAPVAAGARLDLAVSASAGGSAQTLAPVQTAPATEQGYRDLEYVPEEPDELVVADGQVVRLTFTSRSGGYLTLINVGTSGAVTILYPNVQAPQGYLEPGQSRSILLRVKPPAGTDEAIGILTRRPGEMLPPQWRDRVQSGQPVIDAYAGYRDLEFISDQTEQVGEAEYAAAAVKIRH